MKTDLLAQKFPTIRVRNMLPVATTIAYGNGDSVTLAPNAIATISTAGLAQLPSAKVVELVSPTIFDLEKAGVISFTPAAASAEPAAPASPPAKKNK